MYSLKYGLAAEAVHDALPPQTSERLTDALYAVCRDPLGATEPYGVDDKVMRMLVTEYAIVVLLIGHTLRTVTVLQINHLG